MERQLKERLIGAAVLVVVAVVMVPEMFSGPHSHSEQTVDSSSASSGQIKTYHIELQSAHSAEPAPVNTAVEAPAPQPRDEAPVPTIAITPESSSSASARSLPPAPEPAAPVAKVVTPAVPTPAEAPNKGAPTTKPAESDWVVQVGSFAAQDTARQIVGKLKDQGYPAYLGTVKVGSKTLYRVRVGAMPKRAAAEATLQKLKSTYPGASVVPASR